MLIAKDFVILRGVRADGKANVELEREPLRLVTLIDEQAFRDYGNAVIQDVTGFFEARMHDWNWDNGRLRYFTRIAEKADLLIIYEEYEDHRTRFCIECGANSMTGCMHQPKTSV